VLESSKIMFLLAMVMRVVNMETTQVLISILKHLRNKIVLLMLQTNKDLVAL
jgi:hypothetical protein